MHDWRWRSLCVYTAHRLLHKSLHSRLSPCIESHSTRGSVRYGLVRLACRDRTCYGCPPSTLREREREREREAIVFIYLFIFKNRSTFYNQQVGTSDTQRAALTFYYGIWSQDFRREAPG